MNIVITHQELILKKWNKKFKRTFEVALTGINKVNLMDNQSIYQFTKKIIELKQMENDIKQTNALFKAKIYRYDKCINSIKHQLNKLKNP